jgi:hypothetical protein
VSDGNGAPAPPPPPVFPPSPPPRKGTALGWFFAISGSIVLVLTLGCMVAVAGDLRRDDFWIVLMCGSPTLLLGGLFLWLGVRRVKR